VRAAAKLAAALAAISAITLAGGAAAHEVGLSRGDYTVDGAVVEAQVIFARRELIGLVAGLDENHDGALTAAEVDGSREAIEGAIVGRIKVTGDGAACPGKLEGASLTEQDGIAVRARYRCSARPRKVEISMAWLEDLPFGHRHLARAVVGPSSLDFVLSQRSPALSVDVPPGPADAAAPEPAGAPATPSPFWAGARRVAQGYEAPVFLLGLLAASSRARAMALAAAAFAAAVALGIALSALGVFAPAARVVAPLAALSLWYLGVDGFVAPEGDGRWRVAIPFGVVQGFAVAEALRAFDAPRPALFGFMVGAIAALAAATALLLPILREARRRPWFTARGARVIAGSIAAIGLVGFALRL
jgi:hypothetical protein